jgi:hypothetical protein
MYSSSHASSDPNHKYIKKTQINKKSSINQKTIDQLINKKPSINQ